MIAEIPVQERRIPGRFSIVAPVSYDLEDYRPENKATCCDLGLRGARLFVPEGLSVNTQMYLVFHLPESIHKFRAKANIVWQKEAEKRENRKENFLIGVNFFVVSETDKTILSSYVYHHYREELMRFWWRGL